MFRSPRETSWLNIKEEAWLTHPDHASTHFCTVRGPQKEWVLCASMGLGVCIKATANFRFKLEPAKFSSGKNHQLLQEFPQGTDSLAAGRTTGETFPEHLDSRNMGWISWERHTQVTLLPFLTSTFLPHCLYVVDVVHFLLPSFPDSRESLNINIKT